MKRLLSFALVGTLTLTLFSGCGKTSEETVIENSTATEATELLELRLPTYGPTQEIIGRKPVQTEDPMKKLLELGIIEQIGDPSEPMTLGEGLQMLQKVHTARHGSTSVILTQALKIEDTNAPLTRYLMAQFMFLSHMENNDPEKLHGSYEDNLREYLTNGSWWESQTIPPMGSVLVPNNSGELIVNMYNGWLSSKENWIAIPENLQNKYPDKNIGVMCFALLSFDRTNGRKLMELDENLDFCPDETMTRQDAAKSVLSFYNSIEDTADYFGWDSPRGYDASILTPELLDKASQMPQVSSESLPSSWRGIRVRDNKVNKERTSYVTPDLILTEPEIQVIADAGFNYICLEFDFSYLQGPEVERCRLNEARLRELDAIIASCIEKGIHVNLCANSPGNFDEVNKSHHNQQNEFSFILSNDNLKDGFAELWGVLAKRYADVPNNCLSFTPMSGIFGNEVVLAGFARKTVNKIREFSPDRCLIWEVWAGGHTGKAFAEMGMALSFCGTGPHIFNEIDPQENYADVFDNGWPLITAEGTIMDGEAALNNAGDNVISAAQLEKTAKEYGVGFMIGEWGPAVREVLNQGWLLRQRWNDEAFVAYLTDMTELMEEKDYGWCYAGWYGNHGIACGYPAVTDTTYTQVQDYPLYIDEEVFGWFREINGG